MVEGNLPGNTGVLFDPLKIMNSFLFNYPNPFNPTTTIEYNIPGNKTGFLSIHDVTGKVLVKEHVAGRGKKAWSAGKLPSGIYFCKLSTEARTVTRKLVLTK